MSKENDLFGRIVDGKIVEFPVYRYHITNRGHPESWYTPAVEVEKPVLTAFQKYVRSLEISNDKIVVSYAAVDLNLNELFSLVRQKPSLETIGQTQPLAISEIDPAVVQKLTAEISNYAEGKLNEFAQTRGYSDIDKLIGYKGDPFPKFDYEGTRGQILRSQMWIALYTYFDRVMTGQVPVPTSVQEINAVLPELTWGDESN